LIMTPMSHRSSLAWIDGTCDMPIVIVVSIYLR
jgi:hypothetical protein